MVMISIVQNHSNFFEIVVSYYEIHVCETGYCFVFVRRIGGS